MASRIERCGDIDSAMEQGRYEISSLPSSLYGKDKDTARDREVLSAIKSLNYARVHDEIAEIVKYTIEAIHGSNRYQSLIAMPHYAKITEDVIKDIYLKHYC